MRFMLCICLAILVPGAAFAAKSTKPTMPLSQAQAAAKKGDSDAAAAVGTTVDRFTCMNGCADRGYKKDKCTEACQPGICHPGAEEPYCVAK